MTDSTVENLDFDARYTVDGFRGVAFQLDRYATKSVPVTTLVTVCKHCDLAIWPDGHGSWIDETDGDGCDPDVHEPADEPREVETDEFEEVEDRTWVIAIMVGADREHLVEVSSLTKIDDDDYCHECGQIGCAHDGRERD